MKSVTGTLLSWGPLGVFLLAILDSAGIPNPAGVDYLLLLIGWKRPQHAYLGALLAVVGSLIGSYLLFRLARKGGERFLDKHTSGGRGARFRKWFRRYGLVTVFIPGLVPMIPLPMKVFVICAGAFGVSSMAFLGVLALARTVRFLSLAYLGVQLGENATGWLKAHARDFGLLALGLIVFCFLLIKIAGRLHAAEETLNAGQDTTS
jgi:membrane protein YqaA with SNARE-associated domain